MCLHCRMMAIALTTGAIAGQQSDIRAQSRRVTVQGIRRYALSHPNGNLPSASVGFGKNRACEAAAGPLQPKKQGSPFGKPCQQSFSSDSSPEKGDRLAKGF